MAYGETALVAEFVTRCRVVTDILGTVKVVCVLILLCPGCSVFVIGSPSTAKHQGQCETSRVLPITEAVTAVGASALGYALVTEPCDDNFGCYDEAVGAVLIGAAAVYAVSSLVGLSRVGRCKALPAKPRTGSELD